MSLCEVLPPEVPPVDGAVGVGLELVWGVVWEGEADGVALEELVEDLDVRDTLAVPAVVDASWSSKASWENSGHS